MVLTFIARHPGSTARKVANATAARHPMRASSLEPYGNGGPPPAARSFQQQACLIEAGGQRKRHLEGKAELRRRCGGRFWGSQFPGA
jgi:hypothetical protein